MKTNAKKWLVVCLVLLVAVTAKAQRGAGVLPDARVLAKMMLAEKKARQFDESLYVNYLVDSLHFMQKEMTRDEERRARLLTEYSGITEKVFVKDWEKSGRKESMEVTLTSQVDKEDGKMLRSISIQATNHTIIWRIVKELNDFGVKRKAEQGDFMDLKGKGLFAGTGHGKGKYAGMGMHSIVIGCWFDK